ncbi:MAG TPA: hypothetical protein DCG49_12555 [Ruminococcus sp.]|nr:hypothetical protein [Ruminococcus sp.]
MMDSPRMQQMPNPRPQKQQPPQKNTMPQWVVPLLTAVIVALIAVLGFGILLYTHVICFHEWSAATCELPQTCTICGKTVGAPAAHRWRPASCTAPETCEVCGATQGDPLPHTWMPADCEHPKTCSVCGATEGEPLGHDWTAADCETPRYCHTCRKSDGEALGHDWKDADCEHPKTCKRCGKTEGEPLGHKWQAATPSAPETCSVCGETRGSALAATLVGTGYVQTQTGTELNLREKPSTDSKSLAKIPQHTELELYSFGRDDWYYVHYKSFNGYVSADFIRRGSYTTTAAATAPPVITTHTDTVPAAPPQPTLQYGTVRTKYGSDLNLRQSPSKFSRSLCKIPDGTEISFYDNGDGWYFTTYNGKDGYVSSDFIEVH